jgi:hypothetical protein
MFPKGNKAGRKAGPKKRTVSFTLHDYFLSLYEYKPKQWPADKAYPDL